MPSFQNARFSDRSQGLFTPREVEQLMRVEFDRGQRHGHPLVCMLIGIDRLGGLQDLYGAESREEILEAVVEALRHTTREHDLLCCMQDDRILALFPHTAPEVGGMIAKKLLAASRKMRFERDSRTLRVSLSIGIAHNRHKDAISFETLLAVAEEGLVVADSSGGDRFVETELYQLYEQKRRARKREDVLWTPEAAAAATPAGVPAPLPASAMLGETLLELLGAMGVRIDDPHALDRDSLTRILLQLQDQKSHPAHAELAEVRRQNDVLERRIAKLTGELGITEEELRRIAALKNVDLGLASVYRGVQGLAEGESNRQRKKEMMKEIFTANFELKRELDQRSSPPG